MRTKLISAVSAIAALTLAAAKAVWRIAIWRGWRVAAPIWCSFAILVGSAYFTDLIATSRMPPEGTIGPIDVISQMIDVFNTWPFLIFGGLLCAAATVSRWMLMTSETSHSEP